MNIKQSIQTLPLFQIHNNTHFKHVSKKIECSYLDLEKPQDLKIETDQLTMKARHPDRQTHAQNIKTRVREVCSDLDNS